jgi:hypothetical protein
VQQLGSIGLPLLCALQLALHIPGSVEMLMICRGSGWVLLVAAMAPERLGQQLHAVL